MIIMEEKGGKRYQPLEDDKHARDVPIKQRLIAYEGKYIIENRSIIRGGFHVFVLVFELEKYIWHMD